MIDLPTIGETINIYIPINIHIGVPFEGVVRDIDGWGEDGLDPRVDAHVGQFDVMVYGVPHGTNATSTEVVSWGWSSRHGCNRPTTMEVRV